MNNKLNNLITLGEYLARKTSETYAEIAAELAAMKHAAAVPQHCDVRVSPTCDFPLKGKLREQVLYVLKTAGSEGLGTREIIQQLREKGYEYDVEIALPTLPQTLDAMEKRRKEIQVERLPNGRKVHYLNACAENIGMSGYRGQ